MLVDSASVMLRGRRSRFCAWCSPILLLGLSAAALAGEVSIDLTEAVVAEAKKEPAVEASPGAPDSATEGRYRNLELFQKVLNFVEKNYVDEVQNKKLIHGAIKGMLETLDPHSNFLNAEVFKEMKVDTSGKFGGLGIEIGLKENSLSVVAPIEDTPAWRAGIKPGDRILRINGDSTKGLTLVEAVQKMRGKPRSVIRLLIGREGFDRPREFAIERDIIRVQSVKSDELEKGFGYIRLSSFNENAASDVNKALQRLEEKGGKLRGLVFDLRTNPGGLLDQAVDVSSLFLDEGVIVSTLGRNKEQKEVKLAKRGHARKDFALAVLVNSSSASAAEIVAGALQDHRRAIILGTPTFGKGSVQTVVDLGNEVGLKLTIARYYTPSGRSIQEKGVQPDILLDEYDPKLLAEARIRRDGVRERDLKGHIGGREVNGNADSLEKDSGDVSHAARNRGKEADDSGDGVQLKYDPKDDFQVREAVNALKSYELFRKTGPVALEESRASR